MSIPTENQAHEGAQKQQNDKELNFRALEARYEKKLAEERQARIDLEKRLSQPQDEDDSDEPYVDHKKLDKKLAKFGQQTMQQTQSEIKNAVNTALYEERKQAWLDTNADFYDTMQHAEKFAQQDPQLAKTILEMPESFERQKLVYYNIKSRGMDKPPQKEKSIQEKIDSNRRSPYYQPSGVATAPYATQGDFSPGGQKQAYEKLQELKKNLRI